MGAEWQLLDVILAAYQLISSNSVDSCPIIWMSVVMHKQPSSREFTSAAAQMDLNAV